MVIKMTNVLHLINYLGGGGSEIYIYTLAKKLHNNHCKFYIAYSEEGKGLKLFEDLGIETIKLQMNSPFDIKAANELKKICKELSIDVIHTHFLRENYISILSKLLGNKVRVINTRHMLDKNSKSVISMNKFFTRFNDSIIAVSSSVRNQMIYDEGLNPNKIKLIYTGVDLEEWSKPSSLNFRDEYKIPEGEILITTIARFSKEKGHEFLINSIKYFKDYIKTNNPEFKFKFVLVGEGELFNDIIDKAKDLQIYDDIIFTGYRRDIKNILKSSDIFILPSNNEAFGLSILEAMAAGLPVITTNSGGTREIINKDFDNGIIIEYGEIHKLSESLIVLIENKELKEQYIANGYKTLSTHFNIEKTIEETYNLYKGRDI
jgi:glycosyltransferase involved in cell wall biosynthesis